MEIKAVEVLKEQVSYTCGSPLFTVGPHENSIVVREGLNCSAPIETSYYAGL